MEDGMPIYKLYTESGGGWVYSGYELQIAGNSNSGSGLNVMARTDPNTTPPNPGQWSTVSGASRSGNGNPNNPSNGDNLGLPATIGTVTNIEGQGTYSSTGEGTHGAGYYTSQGPIAQEGDWCAATS
jgi:hypothetical protein